MSDSHGGHHNYGGAAGVRPAEASHPRTGSSILLSLLPRGTRGACNGSNDHDRGENLNAKSKSPLPGAPNIDVVYDTLPETTTRVAYGGSLIGETKALDAQAE
jgi:hypothetical protein